MSEKTYPNEIWRGWSELPPKLVTSLEKFLSSWPIYRQQCRWEEKPSGYTWQPEPVRVLCMTDFGYGFKSTVEHLRDNMSVFCEAWQAGVASVEKPCSRPLELEAFES